MAVAQGVNRANTKLGKDICGSEPDVRVSYKSGFFGSTEGYYFPDIETLHVINSGDSSYGKLDKRMYSDLCSDHPIDLCRYQVLNCYCGRAGLINSGGASGSNDLAEAVKTAVINKRAGGMGLISGRKAFQKPMAEGVQLLNAIQDVYLCRDVTIA